VLVSSILATKSKNLISVSSNTPVSDVTQILHENTIGAVLVMEGSKLLGVLSERGIVRAMALNPSGVRAMRADHAMRPTQYRVSADASLEDAMQIMTDHRVRYLPVFEGDELVGLISIGDVVKAELNIRLHEVNSLTNYISGV
jgi:CBS domain-containing protein